MSLISLHIVNKEGNHLHTIRDYDTTGFIPNVGDEMLVMINIKGTVKKRKLFWSVDGNTLLSITLELDA